MLLEFVVHFVLCRGSPSFAVVPAVRLHFLMLRTFSCDSKVFSGPMSAPPMEERLQLIQLFRYNSESLHLKVSMVYLPFHLPGRSTLRSLSPCQQRPLFVNFKTLHAGVLQASLLPTTFYLLDACN